MLIMTKFLWGINMSQLSINQELKLRLFTDNIKKLGEQELKELLIKMFRESMIQHNAYAEIIEKKWGLK
jgi:hypothetical protein